MSSIPDPIHYPHGIVAVDSGYVRPRMDAIHLLVDRGRAAFIDTGTALSVPRCLRALDELNLKPADVDYVIVTHVHLDHAGGAGALLTTLPMARLVVHPRGSRHMIDPSQLLAASIALYGEARMRREYGEVVPVSSERVIEAPHGSRLTLGGRSLLFVDTPGHARHHFCVLDEAHGNLFTGDTMGVSYREFDGPGGPFILPSTVPSQFDPDALHASIDTLEALKPEALYLTHYARIDATASVFADLRRRLDDIVHLVRHHHDDEASLETHLRHYLMNELTVAGCPVDPASARRLWDNDIQLNATGALQWYRRTSDAGTQARQ